MSFIDAFLNVLAILGIIVAGGFIVFFLGDLLLSVLEPKHKKNKYENDDEQSNEKSFSSEKVQEREQSNNITQAEQFSMEEQPAEVSAEKFTMDDEEVKPVDFDEAEKEGQSLGFMNQPQEKVEEKKDDINSIFNEDDDFNFDDNFDFDKLFEDDDKQEAKPATPEAIAEKDILPILPPVSEEKDENNNSSLEEKGEVQNSLAEEQLREEIAELKRELEEQKALYNELKQQAKNNEEKWEIEKANLEDLYKTAEVQIEEKEKPKALLTLEEYTARLNILRERLRENEKELKANKKEFLPLRRVRKNLDKDTAKLRRREALVAKQKVMLYGVNNISEINQEKAKKLAEDLDLLDGLKISVRHCEEVMEANKDRYPILETANRILVTTNKEIKDDITECEEAIAKLKAENGDDEGAELLINSATEAINSANTNEVLVTTDGEVEAPKRRRGRPRKTEISEVAETQNEPVANDDSTEIKIEENKDEETKVEEETPVDIEISNEHLKLFEDIEEEPNANDRKFNFDDEEPSFDDLFAIEQEENKTDNKNENA